METVTDQETATTCIRCEVELTPRGLTRQCPRSPSGSGHEVNAGPWKPGDPVREGSSLHAKHCDRSDPSIWMDPEMPCSCNAREAQA